MSAIGSPVGSPITVRRISPPDRNRVDAVIAAAQQLVTAASGHLSSGVAPVMGRAVAAINAAGTAVQERYNGSMGPVRSVVSKANDTVETAAMARIGAVAEQAAGLGVPYPTADALANLAATIPQINCLPRPCPAGDVWDSVRCQCTGHLRLPSVSAGGGAPCDPLDTMCPAGYGLDPATCECIPPGGGPGGGGTNGGGTDCPTSAFGLIAMTDYLNHIGTPACCTWKFPPPNAPNGWVLWGRNPILRPYTFPYVLSNTDYHLGGEWFAMNPQNFKQCVRVGTPYLHCGNIFVDPKGGISCEPPPPPTNGNGGTTGGGPVCCPPTVCPPPPPPCKTRVTIYEDKTGPDGKPVVTQSSPPDLENICTDVTIYAGSGSDDGAVRPGTPAEGKGGDGLDWNVLEPCKVIDAFLANGTLSVGNLTVTVAPDEVWTDRGSLTVKADEWASHWKYGFKWLGFIVVLTYFSFLWMVSRILRTLTPCAGRVGVFLVPLNAILDLIHKWLGLGIGSIRQRYQMAAAYSCPVNIPGTGEAHVAYLANEISGDTWKCWVRANDDCDIPYSRVMRTQRRRPDLQQWYDLWRRWPDIPVDVDKAERAAGVIQPDESAALRAGIRYYPGPEFLFALEARIVTDPKVARLFALDAEYIGANDSLINDFQRGHSVIDDFRKLHWRLHWRPPSLAEAFHAECRFGKDRILGGADPPPDEMDTLMRMHGVPITWRQKLHDLMYELPGERKLKPLYERSIIDDDALRRLLAAVCMHPIMIEPLLKLHALEKEDWAEGRAWAKGYRSCLYNYNEAQTEAIGENLPMPVFDRVIAKMEALRRLDLRHECTAGVKAQFMAGGLNVSQAQTALIRLGHDVGCVSQLVAEWRCRLASRPKEIGASELCTWADNGLLSLADMSGRLIGLGYTAADAARIVAMCELRHIAKQAKQQAQQAAAKAKEQAKKKADEKKKSGSAIKQATDDEHRRLLLEQATLMVLETLGFGGKGGLPAGSPTDAQVEATLLHLIRDLHEDHWYTLDGAYQMVRWFAKEAKSGQESDPLAYIDEQIRHLPKKPADDESVTGNGSGLPGPHQP